MSSSAAQVSAARLPGEWKTCAAVQRSSATCTKSSRTMRRMSRRAASASPISSTATASARHAVTTPSADASSHRSPNATADHCRPRRGHGRSILPKRPGTRVVAGRPRRPPRLHPPHRPQMDHRRAPHRTTGDTAPLPVDHERPTRQVHRTRRTPRQAARATHPPPLRRTPRRRQLMGAACLTHRKFQPPHQRCGVRRGRLHRPHRQRAAGDGRPGRTQGRPLANLAEHASDQLTALVKTRLKWMQYRPGFLDGYLTNTGLNLTSS